MQDERLLHTRCQVFSEPGLELLSFLFTQKNTLQQNNLQIKTSRVRCTLIVVAKRRSFERSSPRAHGLLTQPPTERQKNKEVPRKPRELLVLLVP